MSRKPIPRLEGKRFGRLVATSHAGKDRHGQYWLCVCDCGEVRRVLQSNLLTGNTKSCGCFHRDVAVENGRNTTRHGHWSNQYPSPTWITWQAMKRRCLKTDDKDFPRYGARGIGVCAQWMVFENFLADMGERPAGRTIHRINNDGNYEPDNCCWATPKEQAANRRPRKRSAELRPAQGEG